MRVRHIARGAGRALTQNRRGPPTGEKSAGCGALALVASSSMAGEFRREGRYVCEHKGRKGLNLLQARARNSAYSPVALLRQGGSRRAWAPGESGAAGKAAVQEHTSYFVPLRRVV